VHGHAEKGWQTIPNNQGRKQLNAGSPNRASEMGYFWETQGGAPIVDASLRVSYVLFFGPLQRVHSRKSEWAQWFLCLCFSVRFNGCTVGSLNEPYRSKSMLLYVFPMFCFSVRFSGCTVGSLNGPNGFYVFVFRSASTGAPSGVSMSPTAVLSLTLFAFPIFGLLFGPRNGPRNGGPCEPRGFLEVHRDFRRSSRQRGLQVGGWFRTRSFAFGP